MDATAFQSVRSHHPKDLQPQHCERTMLVADDRLMLVVDRPASMYKFYKVRYMLILHISVRKGNRLQPR
jgi:hypothetical protein